MHHWLYKCVENGYNRWISGHMLIIQVYIISHLISVHTVICQYLLMLCAMIYQFQSVLYYQNSLNKVCIYLLYCLYHYVYIGLKDCRWPGRCQTIEKDGITYYLDGAHTLNSLTACVKWFDAAATNEAKDKWDCLPTTSALNILIDTLSFVYSCLISLATERQRHCCLLWWWAIRLLV